MLKTSPRAELLLVWATASISSIKKNFSAQCTFTENVQSAQLSITVHSVCWTQSLLGTVEHLASERSDKLRPFSLRTPRHELCSFSEKKLLCLHNSEGFPQMNKFSLFSLKWQTLDALNASQFIWVSQCLGAEVAQSLFKLRTKRVSNLWSLPASGRVPLEVKDKARGKDQTGEQSRERVKMLSGHLALYTAHTSFISPLPLSGRKLFPCNKELQSICRVGSPRCRLGQWVDGLPDCLDELFLKTAAHSHELSCQQERK